MHVGGAGLRHDVGEPKSEVMEMFLIPERTVTVEQRSHDNADSGLLMAKIADSILEQAEHGVTGGTESSTILGSQQHLGDRGDDHDVGLGPDLRQGIGQVT